MKLFSLLFFIFSFTLNFAQDKSIIKVLQSQEKEWNAGNLEGFMEGYWKNDSLVFIGRKGPKYGWENLLNQYKKSYPNENKMGRLEFSDLKIIPLGRKYAQVIGKWKLYRKVDEPNGIFTLVFKKFKKGWKIISDHTQ